MPKNTSNKNFAVRFFEWLSASINGGERAIIDLASAVVPYMVPIIPAYLMYDHAMNHMGFEPWIAKTAGVVVELLGLASVSTAVRFFLYNRRFKKDAKNEKKNNLDCTSVLAAASYDLIQGRKIEEIGSPDISIHVKNPLRPLLGNDWIEGQIIFTDNFENVIVNIHRDEFEEQRKGRSFKIVFKRDEVIDRISDTYADVNEGEKLAMFNSAGYLEIAINKGNAAGLLGLQGFSERQLQQSQYLNSRLFYQTVKVFFE